MQLMPCIIWFVRFCLNCLLGTRRSCIERVQVFTYVFSKTLWTISLFLRPFTISSQTTGMLKHFYFPLPSVVNSVVLHAAVLFRKSHKLYPPLLIFKLIFMMSRFTDKYHQLSFDLLHNSLANCGNNECF